MSTMTVVASEPPPAGWSESLGNLCNEVRVSMGMYPRQDTSGAQKSDKVHVAVCVLKIPGRSSCGWWVCATESDPCHIPSPTLRGT